MITVNINISTNASEIEKRNCIFLEMLLTIFWEKVLKLIHMMEEYHFNACLELLTQI